MELQLIAAEGDAGTPKTSEEASREGGQGGQCGRGWVKGRRGANHSRLTATNLYG